MRRLPRSIRLALWANAVTSGRASISEAVEAVTGADERHQLAGDDLPFSGHPAGPGLAEWLDGLADRGIRVCRAVLPVPGDPSGIPAGPSAAPAMDSGEAVVSTAGTGADTWLLVPRIEHFGTQWEPGTQVTWHSHRLAGTPVTWLDPAETEQRLRRALVEVASAMEELDIGDADRQLRARLSALRGAPAMQALPPGTSARAARLIAHATRLSPIIALATTDDGAAISAWERDRRRNLLREINSCLREALMVATDPRT